MTPRPRSVTARSLSVVAVTALGLTLLGAAPAFAVDSPTSATTPEWTGQPATTFWSALVSTPGDRSMKVSFPAATARGGSAITSYRVLVINGGAEVAGRGCTLAAAVPRSCTVSGLTNGKGYNIKVEATNALAETTTTTAASATTVPFGRPVAPTTVTAKAGYEALTGSWPAAAGNGRPITGYTVKLYRTDTGKRVSLRTTSGTTRTVSFTGLIAGVRYRLTVTASTAYPTASTVRTSNTVVPVLPPATKLPLRPGQTGPIVTQVKQRLRWAGLPVPGGLTYDPATVKQVKHFQEKFLISQTGNVGDVTWKQLKAVTRSKGKLPSECTGTVICISKQQRLLRYLVNGKVRIATDVRFGPEYDPSLRTRNGVHYIFSKDRYHVSSQFRTNMFYAMFFDGGQAIHLSLYFLADGYYGNSHGCVNVRDEKAVSALYDRASIGTKVYIYG